MQGVKPVGLLGALEHRTQPHQFVGRTFVGHGDQDMVLLPGGFILVVLRVTDGDVVGAALRGEGRHGAGRQDHQDRAVEHAFVQQADRLPVGRMAQDDVVADHHGGERRGHVGRTQAEDDGPLVGREAEGLLREPRGDEFGRRGHDDHHGTDLDRLEAGEESTVVDQHPDAQQKEGDEDRIADELHAVHQRRSGGDQPVECQPCEKRPDDCLQSGQLGEKSAQKNHRQHKDVL